MENKNKCRDCVHTMWGIDFCILCGGIFISCLDFLIMIVVISSLAIWIGSASGLAMHPEEKEKWQKQLDESIIIFIVSACTLTLSIILNNCCLEKYSSCYKCCKHQETSVHPDV